MTSLEVLFTPADFAALGQRDLSAACCVVFDVLRATSSMVTALANGAAAILPVEEIGQALSARKEFPGALLAGERQGVRIGPELTGGTAFDLGNSPREFTPETVRGKTIVMTTTNGTRALRACLKAQTTLAASFLNLGATYQAILQRRPTQLFLVCSGTHDQAAYEDVLGAGALCDRLWPECSSGKIADSAHMARELFLQVRDDLERAVSRARNARRLLEIPELRADVAFCVRRDTLSVVAGLDRGGWVRTTGSKPDPT
jgi:2-phosphosulfolactate phosphatase